MPPVSMLLVVPTVSSALVSLIYLSPHLPRPYSRLNGLMLGGIRGDPTCNVMTSFAHRSHPVLQSCSPAHGLPSSVLTSELGGKNWVLKEVRAAHLPHANHAQPYQNIKSNEERMKRRMSQSACEDGDVGQERPGDVAHIRRADEHALALHTAGESPAGGVLALLVVILATPHRQLKCFIELKTSMGLKWGGNLSSVYIRRVWGSVVGDPRAPIPHLSRLHPSCPRLSSDLFLLEAFTPIVSPTELRLVLTLVKPSLLRRPDLATLLPHRPQKLNKTTFWVTRIMAFWRLQEHVSESYDFETYCSDSASNSTNCAFGALLTL
ncbi:hypothetical protein B0H13DRAFT_1927805 [Mycena leptocephala]|nr:hypothetical protein B0H13DRAFT_1927805 [Mycena leptocephala]